MGGGSGTGGVGLPNWYHLIAPILGLDYPAASLSSL